MLPTRPRLTVATQHSAGLAASRNKFMKNWFAWEAMPIVGIIVTALTGASWLLYRSTKRPDVVWTRSNAEPWSAIKQDETVKLWHGNHRFEKKWKRSDW